jgi:cobalt-zinc-cadmium efflux system outer membrane protein
MENRTDLRAARAQVSRAENSVALVKRMRFPDIGLFLGYSVQGTDPQSLQVTPPTVTIGLTTTLPIFYQQQGEIQKANADLRTQRLLVAKLEAQVVADVEAAWAAFKGWEALVKRMEQGGLLEWAKRAQDLVLIQYQKGAASLLEYLDARRTYIATNVEYQQDLAGYWTWVFQLQQAIGPERPKQ